MRRLEVTALALNPKQGRKGEAQRHRHEKKFGDGLSPAGHNWKLREGKARRGRTGERLQGLECGIWPRQQGT